LRRWRPGTPRTHESGRLRQVRASEVLRLEEVERPVPKDNEVLIKVHATTVNRTDTGLRSAEYFISRFLTGLLRPKRKIPGTELAGEVEAVGPARTPASAENVVETGGFPPSFEPSSDRLIGLGHLEKGAVS
jgi:NADPH:quinone reductase-like Zn-dependent oxidoreductase